MRFDEERQRRKLLRMSQKYMVFRLLFLKNGLAGSVSGPKGLELTVNHVLLPNN